MKRTVSILLIALFLALPAAARQSFSTFDYRSGSAGGGRFLYYDFPDITLYLPASWDGLFTMEQGDSGVSFYQTASRDRYAEEGIPGGGLLFTLCASGDQSFRELPAYEYLGYSDNVGLHFYLMLPSDYPAWPDDDAIRGEYDAMAGDIAEIAGMASVAPNMCFYTDGVESTDIGMS